MYPENEEKEAQKASVTHILLSETALKAECDMKQPTEVKSTAA